MVAEFTDRMREVLQGLQNHWTPKRIGAELGISPQQVDNNIRKLRRRGYIRRRDNLPAYAVYAQNYPWEIVKPAPAPSLPAGAKLRAEYTQTSQRDSSVEPITLIRWGRWSVQGIPILHPEGKTPKQEATPWRVVLIYVLTPAGVMPPGAHAVFLASRQQPWTEQDTDRELPRWGGPHANIRDLTMVIAAAIGVEAVLERPD